MRTVGNCNKRYLCITDMPNKMIRLFCSAVPLSISLSDTVLYCTVLYLLSLSLSCTVLYLLFLSHSRWVVRYCTLRYCTVLYLLFLCQSRRVVRYGTYCSSVTLAEWYGTVLTTADATSYTFLIPLHSIQWEGEGGGGGGGGEGKWR